jgi:hypothetical protein
VEGEDLFGKNKGRGGVCGWRGRTFSAKIKEEEACEGGGGGPFRQKERKMGEEGGGRPESNRGGGEQALEQGEGGDCLGETTLCVERPPFPPCPTGKGQGPLKAVTLCLSADKQRVTAFKEHLRKGQGPLG